MIKIGYIWIKNRLIRIYVDDTNIYKDLRELVVYGTTFVTPTNFTLVDESFAAISKRWREKYGV